MWKNCPSAMWSPHGHGIAKGLQDGLCLQDPLLDLRGDAAAGARHKAQVLHHLGVKFLQRSTNGHWQWQV
jgi:hypothetical protein